MYIYKECPHTPFLLPLRSTFVDEWKRNSFPRIEKKCCHGAQPNPRLHLLIFSSTPLSGFGPNPPIHKAKGEFTERVQINLTGKN